MLSRRRGLAARPEDGLVLTGVVVAPPWSRPRWYEPSASNPVARSPPRRLQHSPGGMRRRQAFPTDPARSLSVHDGQRGRLGCQPMMHTAIAVWLPLPTSTALALVTDIPLCVFVALCYWSTSSIVIWALLIFLTGLYAYLYQSSLLAASPTGSAVAPAASALFLRVPLVLCLTTSWMVFLGIVNSVFSSPAQRTVLQPMVATISRRVHGEPLAGAAELEVSWITANFTLGSFACLTALFSVWRLIGRHRSCISADVDTVTPGPGGRLTVVDILLAQSPRGSQGGHVRLNETHGAGPGAEKTQGPGTVGTVRRALLPYGGALLAAQCILAVTQVLALWPTGDEALFRTHGASADADSTAPGSGSAAVGTPAGAQVVCLSLVGFSLLLGVGLMGRARHYLLFFRAASNAELHRPRSLRRSGPEAGRHSLPAHPGMEAHLWWLVRVLPNAMVSLVVQFACGSCPAAGACASLRL